MIIRVRYVVYSVPTPVARHARGAVLIKVAFSSALHHGTSGSGVDSKGAAGGIAPECTDMVGSVGKSREITNHLYDCDRD
jgi:hypothetical protein